MRTVHRDAERQEYERQQLHQILAVTQGCQYPEPNPPKWMRPDAATEEEDEEEFDEDEDDLPFAPDFDLAALNDLHGPHAPR